MSEEIFLESLGIRRSIKPADHCTDFQGQISAIEAGVETARDMRASTVDITILFDCQATIVHLI